MSTPRPPEPAAAAPAPDAPPPGSRPDAAPWPEVAAWWRQTYGSLPTDDVLAREYYARALAAAQQRATAEEQWRAYRRRQAAAPAPRPAAPRRSGAVLAAAFVAILVVACVATFLLASVVWKAARDWLPDPGAAYSKAAALAQQGPRPVMGRAFTPSHDQIALFLKIGAFGDGGHVTRWSNREVDVKFVGGSSAGDRLLLGRILADVNHTVGAPRFTYSSRSPEIVIRFVPHATFAARHPEAIGWCHSWYSTSDYSLTRAIITIDDSPDLRSERSATLAHEIGHAIGLDDTRDPRWSGIVMYYQEQLLNPSDFTTADLAAISMLYDRRLDGGDTRRDIRRIWP